MKKSQSSSFRTTAQLCHQAIDFHCHGVGQFDFTEIANMNLQEINDILQQRNHHTILTLYLPRNSFEAFLDLMDKYAAGKKAGKYSHISGFGLEGPLLASHGGTPHKGVWNPNKSHWQRLAACGEKGLVYVIFSPDVELNSHVGDSLGTPAKSVVWIAETLLEGGVLPAAGHFRKNNPIASAQALQSVYDVVAEWGQGPTVTDHLYNDMPHNFKHAWRSLEERSLRDRDIQTLQLESWSLDNLESKLGPVPTTMIRNARKGLVKIAQNFDGEHVDLAIVKKTVALVGAENMLMMTDSIESKRLAGRDLHQHEDSTLLYQDEDIVAAGSQNIDAQIQNMVLIGLTPDQIKSITYDVPSMILMQHKEHKRAKTYSI